jgi:hypothetical protein
VQTTARQAFADRRRLMVAKAAELTGDRRIYALEPDLITAYRRAVRASAEVAIAELGAYRNNARPRGRPNAVSAERDEPRLGAGYAKAYPVTVPGA